MLSAHQPLALWLVFVMEVSSLRAVCLVPQQGTKELPIQPAAGSDGTWAAADVADLTAGRLARLFGGSCTTKVKPRLVGHRLSFPCWLDQMCPAVTPPECSSVLLSWCWCRGLHLLLGIEEWNVFIHDQWVLKSGGCMEDSMRSNKY